MAEVLPAEESTYPCFSEHAAKTRPAVKAKYRWYRAARKRPGQGQPDRFKGCVQNATGTLHRRQNERVPLVWWTPQPAVAAVRSKSAMANPFPRIVP